MTRSARSPNVHRAPTVWRLVVRERDHVGVLLGGELGWGASARPFAKRHFEALLGTPLPNPVHHGEASADGRHDLLVGTAVIRLEQQAGARLPSRGPRAAA
jgi:hypothetical protein